MSNSKDKIIECWKVTINGNSCICDFSTVSETIELSDVDEIITVSRIEMNEKEYFNLPEFQGF